MKPITFRFDEQTYETLKLRHEEFQQRLGMNVSLNSYVNRAITKVPSDLDVLKTDENVFNYAPNLYIYPELKTALTDFLSFYQGITENELINDLLEAFLYSQSLIENKNKEYIRVVVDDESKDMPGKDPLPF